MNWVASASKKLYYPVACPAALKLPEADRLYYDTEDGPRRDGFQRGPGC
jgi:hypothetical protein